MTTPYFAHGAGGTLDGIAQLIAGLGKLNNPNQAQQAQLLQRIQQDPAILQQLKDQLSTNSDPNQALQNILGKKPLIGSGNYDKILQTVSNLAISPDQVEKNNIAALQARDYKFGGGGTNQFTPDQLTAADKAGALTPDEQNTLDQYRSKTTGKLTKQQQAREDALTAGANQNLLDDKTKADLSNNYRKVASTAVGALPAGTNLFQADFEGKKFDTNTKAAILATPEYEKQYQDDMQSYYEQKHLDIDRANADPTKVKVAHDLTLASQLVSEASHEGKILGTNEALAAIQNPDAVRPYREGGKLYTPTEPTDPTAKPLWNAAQFFDKTKNDLTDKQMNSALNDFNRYALPVFARIPEGSAHQIIPDQSTVDGLNAAASNAFTQYGLDAPVYGLSSQSTSHLGGIYHTDKPTIVLLHSGDKMLQGKIPETENNTTNTAPPDLSALKGQAFNILKNSGKYKTPQELKTYLDGLTQQQLQAIIK